MQADYNIYDNLRYTCENSSKEYAILKIAILDESLIGLYDNKIETHNESFKNNKYHDSGFDLFVPEDVSFDNAVDSKFIDMKIKAEMVYCNMTSNKLTPTAFTLHPRSSISKTPLMLANNTGIIDSGYRGNLIGAFRALKLNDNSAYTVNKHTRLIQICHSSLCPLYVVIVSENELSDTARGSGGFGSTGK
jgi:dUTP pyrophosphatase|tara:strand:- start:842 stop:1414 length:573 start_codon:yes stop_codon:yes gene_type:complete